MEIENQIQEGNSNINNSNTWVRKSTRMTTVNLNSDLWKLAKQNMIPFNKALEFGIQFINAEIKQDASHPRNSLHDKIAKLIQKLEAKSLECEGLRKQTDITEEEKEEDLDKEMDEILGAKAINNGN